VNQIAIAAIIAGIMSLCLLVASHRKRLSGRAWFYILLRMSVDGSSAIPAYPVVANSYPQFTFLHEPVAQVLLAALIGPGFLRSQVTIVDRRSPRGVRAVGPAVKFNEFLTWIDRSIDQISSVAQTRWMNTKVVPVLGRYTVSQLHDEAKQYLNGLDRIEPKALKGSLDYVEKVAKDADGEGDEQAKRAILQHLLDNSGRRLVEDLVRRRVTTSH
jgi:hypothetical protein